MAAFYIFPISHSRPTPPRGSRRPVVIVGLPFLLPPRPPTENWVEGRDKGMIQEIYSKDQGEVHSQSGTGPPSSLSIKSSSSFPHLLPRGRLLHHPSNLGFPKEGKGCGGCPLVLEKKSDGWGAWVFLPAGLPDPPPHHLALDSLGFAYAVLSCLKYNSSLCRTRTAGFKHNIEQRFSFPLGALQYIRICLNKCQIDLECI